MSEEIKFEQTFFLIFSDEIQFCNFDGHWSCFDTSNLRINGMMGGRLGDNNSYNVKLINFLTGAQKSTKETNTKEDLDCTIINSYLFWLTKIHLQNLFLLFASCFFCLFVEELDRKRSNYIILIYCDVNTLSI